MFVEIKYKNHVEALFGRKINSDIFETYDVDKFEVSEFIDAISEKFENYRKSEFTIDDLVKFIESNVGQIYKGTRNHILLQNADYLTKAKKIIFDTKELNKKRINVLLSNFYLKNGILYEKHYKVKNQNKYISFHEIVDYKSKKIYDLDNKINSINREEKNFVTIEDKIPGKVIMNNMLHILKFIRKEYSDIISADDIKSMKQNIENSLSFSKKTMVHTICKTKHLIDKIDDHNSELLDYKEYLNKYFTKENELDIKND